MRKTTKQIQIRKVARVKDKTTSDYFEIIEFPVSNMERSRIDLPRVPSWTSLRLRGVCAMPGRYCRRTAHESASWASINAAPPKTQVVAFLWREIGNAGGQRSARRQAYRQY